MKIITSAALLAALSGTVAVAQSGPDLSMKGFVAAGNLYSSGETQSFYAGNFDIGGSFLSLGAGSLGFDLGVTALGTLDSSDSYSAYYPALTYTFGSNKVSIGAPRSAYDTVGSEPDYTQITGLIGAELGFATKSSLSLAMLVNDVNVYGLRYDGSFGAITGSATYHNLTSSGDSGDVIAISGSYDAGTFTAFGAYENLSVGSNSVDRFKIGGHADFGQFGGGASYSQFQATGDDAYDILRAYGSYDVTDKIEVLADFTNLSSTGNSSNIYSITGKYRVLQGAYVAASYLDGKELESITSVSIGYDF